MKNKKTIFIMLLLISVFASFTIAAKTMINFGTSYISVSGDTIKGTGYTASDTQATWLAVRCSLMVPGYSTAVDSSTKSAENTKGPIYAYVYASRSVHLGEKMYTTCTHWVAINQVPQPVWTTRSATITIK
jgi:hypothetical protein